MAMKWYVVHTYSGHENKAKLSLTERVKQMNMDAHFGRVLIPTESVLEVMIIPHTLGVTTLGELKPGSRINLEIDTLARYAVRFLEVTTAADPEAGLKKALRQAGYGGPDTQ